MNKMRRKALQGIVAQMDALSETLAEIKEALEGVCDEEQKAFDNMPEGLQDSERGEQMQEYIETMSEALEALEALEELRDQLEEIAEG